MYYLYLYCSETLIEKKVILFLSVMVMIDPFLQPFLQTILVRESWHSHIGIYTQAHTHTEAPRHGYEVRFCCCCCCCCPAVQLLFQLKIFFPSFALTMRTCNLCALRDIFRCFYFATPTEGIIILLRVL